MKYLKVFESKILDDILDKISNEGEKTLTSWEREYLASYDDVHKRTKMEDEHKKREASAKEKDDKYKSFGEYDPREDDTDFYKELGDLTGVGDDMDNFLKNMSDEDYKEGQLEQFWDMIDDEDINEFFDSFHVYGDYGTTRWEDLPKDVKQKFQMYLIQKGYINK
jgi:hypothetical protein